MPRVSYNPDYNPFAASTPRTAQPQKPAVPDQWQQLYEAALQRPQQQEAPLFDDQMPEEQPSDDIIAEKSPVHYQYKGRYIMTAVKSGLMIIDQQRADIRIRYERLMERLRQNTAGTQRVLFPEVVQFPPSEQVFMDLCLPELQAMGFDISNLGTGSYAVNGVPAGFDGIDPVSLVRHIVADAADKGVVDPSELNVAMAISLARHAALAPGQVLTNDDMERIINDLFACSNVNYTPDGKAILTILPQRDIEQLLG